MTKLYLTSFCFVDGFITVFCLKSVATQKIFFYCDWCGLAWPELPFRQAVTAADLKKRPLRVIKRAFDFKRITVEEFQQDNDDFLYFYDTDVKDVDWRDIAPRGIAMPSWDELIEAGLDEHLIFVDEKTEQEVEDNLWEMWALTYKRAGENERALQLINKHLAGKQYTPRHVLRWRGEAYAALGDHESAQRDFDAEAELQKLRYKPPPPTPEGTAKRKAVIEASKRQYREKYKKHLEAEELHLQRRTAKLQREENKLNE